MSGKTLHNTLCEMLLHVVIFAFHVCLQLAKAHHDLSVLSQILGCKFDLPEGACQVLLQSTANLNQEQYKL